MVVVDHHRGGRVALVACERCQRAVNRLVAVANGQGRPVALVRVDTGEAARVTVERVRQAPPPPAPEVSSVRSELMIETDLETRDEAGQRYDVRICGRQRPDGTWIGWIEFVAADSAEGLRTGRETTQPDLDALRYWAGGLEPTYFEGAFNRAH